MTPFQLSLLDREECPKGVPLDVWTLFVREADKVWNSGRTHYSARTLLEFIRHHQIIDAGNRDFVVNNNWQAIMSRSYMSMRNRWGYFEIRGNTVLDRAA